jgi:hypothetical protein
MVTAARRGQALRRVARRFGVSLCTVQRWVGHAAGQRLDRVDWSDRPSGCHLSTRRVPSDLEDRVLALRQELRASSALGEYGAAAIHRALRQEERSPRVCVRTIHRILERRGALDGQRRRRHAPPPRGWYLPDLAARRVELDSFDLVEGLVIRGGTDVTVLNGISLHGGLCVSWPRGAMTAQTTAELLVEHWRRYGLPAYAQFDNGAIFTGTHRWSDSFGRVLRLCLSLEVTPVLVPPRETGFQAMIENYNGRWQAKVWSRFQHPSLAALGEHSDRFVAAASQRAAARLDAAPSRRPFPRRWHWNPLAPLRGRVVFLRRADDTGSVSLLGHDYAVSALWPHRLVRAEVDLDREVIQFLALRRRDPTHQPLLAKADYQVPKAAFHD